MIHDTFEYVAVFAVVVYCVAVVTLPFPHTPFYHCDPLIVQFFFLHAIAAGADLGGRDCL